MIYCPQDQLQDNLYISNVNNLTINNFENLVIIPFFILLKNSKIL